jgi:hypothetical protein
VRTDEGVVPSRNFRGGFWAAAAVGWVVQQGESSKEHGGHTHIAIADNTPSLAAREQVARFDETFDELLLQT